MKTAVHSEEGTVAKNAGDKASSDKDEAEVKLYVAGVIEVPKAPPYDTDGDADDQSHNMSGLFCPPDADWCLTVADELRGFHRLKVDRSGERPKVSHDAALELVLPTAGFLDEHGLDQKHLKEFDLEAIADVGDDVIFVGSHANKRTKGTVNPGAHLVAIADKEALRTKVRVPANWTSLDEMFKAKLPGRLNQQLQCGGINIEGATVFNGRLLIGLRSPTQGATDDQKPGAYVISTPLEGVLKEDFSGAELHGLPTRARFIGIRSMETIGDTILLVTGDAGVNDLEDDQVPQCGANLNKEDDGRPFELRAWKPRSGNLMESRVLFKFPEKKDNRKNGKKENSTGPGRAKVEGIAMADRKGNTVSLFVVYDGRNEVFYLPDVKLP
jgi:hypothetical protein